MARGITMEDLTKGLLNYKYTGLTFEKGDKAGDLRYVFFLMYYFNVLHGPFMSINILIHLSTFLYLPINQQL